MAASPRNYFTNHLELTEESPPKRSSLEVRCPKHRYVRNEGPILLDSSIGDIFAELADEVGEPDAIMIDAAHFKSHRTAENLLKKGGLAG